MNKYITVMFPYPSGSGLHVGHWYNYAIVDSYCKIQKWQGHNVYQPFGYDAFGLPAENYAKKVGRDPKEVTWENINSFSREIKRMNTSFEEKLITCSESYIRATHELFRILLSKGLAYKADREQDYCPSCETVLAKEQTRQKMSGLVCERCDTITYKKKLNQWFFKITDYKQRLIDDLSKVDYPESTKKQQMHWLENLTDWCVSRQRKWGCSIPVEGETDTLDTFVDSSFYTTIYDPERPVDIYIGGKEHACMHLIYARFITKVLYDAGRIPYDEPFKQVIHQGMILGEDGEKMSKSKGNVVNPKQYEPQLLRMYLMFINHYFEGGKWQDSGYKGCERFRNKFTNWLGNTNSTGMFEFEIKFKEFEQKIINYFDSWKVNKVLSEWMIFYNNNKNEYLTKEQSLKLYHFFNTCF